MSNWRWNVSHSEHYIISISNIFLNSVEQSKRPTKTVLERKSMISACKRWKYRQQFSQIIVRKEFSFFYRIIFKIKVPPFPFGFGKFIHSKFLWKLDEKWTFQHFKVRKQKKQWVRRKKETKHKTIEKMHTNEKNENYSLKQGWYCRFKSCFFTFIAITTGTHKSQHTKWRSNYFISNWNKVNEIEMILFDFNALELTALTETAHTYALILIAFCWWSADERKILQSSQ